MIAYQVQNRPMDESECTMQPGIAEDPMAQPAQPPPYWVAVTKRILTRFGNPTGNRSRHAGFPGWDACIGPWSLLLQDEEGPDRLRLRTTPGGISGGEEVIWDAQCTEYGYKEQVRCS